MVANHTLITARQVHTLNTHLKHKIHKREFSIKKFVSKMSNYFTEWDVSPGLGAVCVSCADLVQAEAFSWNGCSQKENTESTTGASSVPVRVSPMP